MAAQFDVFLVKHQVAPSVDFLLCTHGRTRPNLWIPTFCFHGEACVSVSGGLCCPYTDTWTRRWSLCSPEGAKLSYFGTCSPKAPPSLLPPPLPSTSVSLVVSEPRWCRWCPSPVLAVLYKLCVVCLGLLFFSVKSWWCLTKACFKRFWAKGGHQGCGTPAVVWSL